MSRWAALQRFAAMFAALIITWLLLGAGTIVAEYFGQDPTAGAALIGFFGTLFLVFNNIVRIFGIEPPAEFQEVTADG